jgi:hypothetical protein
LIATELVMNALKHAFPNDKSDGQITVGYDAARMDWKLWVADNGIGRPDGVFAQPKAGLGTSIVKALAHQLDAQVETLAGRKGTTVSITRATFSAKIRAAKSAGNGCDGQRSCNAWSSPSSTLLVDVLAPSTCGQHFFC